MFLDFNIDIFAPLLVRICYMYKAGTYYITFQFLEPFFFLVKFKFDCIISTITISQKLRYNYLFLIKASLSKMCFNFYNMYQFNTMISYL